MQKEAKPESGIVYVHSHVRHGRRYRCPVQGCSVVFMQATDLSRHKWDHVPRHLLPSCPSRDPRCPFKYTGRSTKVKLHMQKEHPGLPTKYNWPTLNEVMMGYLVALPLKEETFQPVDTASTSHSQPVVPFPSIGAREAFDHTLDDFERMENYIQRPSSQSYLPGSTNPPKGTPIQLIPQTDLWGTPLTPSRFSTTTSQNTALDSSFPEFLPLDTPSVPYSSVDGPHVAVEGLVDPQQSVQSQSLDQFLRELDFLGCLNAPEAPMPLAEWSWVDFLRETA